VVTGYRCGAVGDYSGGDPKEASIAWKALQYEHDEQGNDDTESVAKFLGILATRWSDVLTEFKRRYPNTQGIWLSRNKKEAEQYREFGDPEPVKYDKKNVIIDLGGDGIFVLNDRSLEDDDLGYVNEQGQWEFFQPKGSTRYDHTKGKYAKRRLYPNLTSIKELK